MIRSILTNKWIIGGLGFLVIFAGLCYLWYQWTMTPYREQAAETEELRSQWETEKAQTNNASETVLQKAPAESNNTTAEKPITPELPRIGEIVNGRIYLGTERPSPEILAQLNAPSEDELISPYGFGSYPELPEGFGPITWPRKDAESELMIRVHIKLLNQGVPVEGIVMSGGLVYPIIKGVCYVTWRETSDGLRYLHRARGHPDDDIRSIANEKEAQGEMLTQADVPHIKLVPMEEGGIDPWTFLNLPK